MYDIKWKIINLIILIIYLFLGIINILNIDVVRILLWIHIVIIFIFTPKGSERE